MAVKKITEKTKVKVMNNTVGSASFYDANDKLVRFPKRGAVRQVTVEDLDFLYRDAYKMLEEGYIIPLDKGVCDYLTSEYGIDYERIIKFDEIDELLDSKTVEELRKVLEKAPEPIKNNIAQRAKEKKLDSKSKSKVIKETTNKDIDEIE